MILIIVVTTILANVADILLKVGANDAGTSFTNALALFATPWIWLGAVIGITAMGIWVYILGRHNISHAYPVFVGVGFINVTLASWLYLHESVGPLRVAGIALILAGIVVIHLQAQAAARRAATAAATPDECGSQPDAVSATAAQAGEEAL